MTNPENDQPRVLGVRTTAWVTGVALALIAGSAVGAVQGGLLTTHAGDVTVTTETPSPAPAPALTTTPEARPPVLSSSRQAAARIVTITGRSAAVDTDTSTSSAVVVDTDTSTSSTGSPAVNDTSSSKVSDPPPSKRTDCPIGYIPDENGGCIVDHGADGNTPSPGQQVGDGSPAPGSGQTPHGKGQSDKPTPPGHDKNINSGGNAG